MQQLDGASRVRGLALGAAGQLTDRWTILANYTFLDTHGKFGGADYLTSGQVAGFIPRTANLSLSWRYRALSARYLVNYTGPYLQTYSSASPGRSLFRFDRTISTLGFGYQIRPWLTVTCDIDNLFNEPLRRYRGVPDQLQFFSMTGTTVTFGLNGRF